MEKEKSNKIRKRRDATVYVVLRALVIFTLVMQVIHGNFENVFFCVLTLVLLLLPIIIDHKLNIKLPTLLESIIFIFIFAAEILGFVNFIGAVTFSIIGFLYIENRDKYKFAENFMPTKKTPEEIEISKKEFEEFKNSRKRNKKKK